MDRLIDWLTALWRMSAKTLLDKILLTLVKQNANIGIIQLLTGRLKAQEGMIDSE